MTEFDGPGVTLWSSCQLSGRYNSCYDDLTYLSRRNIQNKQRRVCQQRRPFCTQNEAANLQNQRPSYDLTD